jgi:hypothetical protein
VKQDGTFISPPLPDDVVEADITVVSAGVAKDPQPVFKAPFHSTQQPTFVEMTLGAQNSRIQPISAVLKVRKNGADITRANVGDRVSLLTSLTNIALDAPGLDFTWNVTTTPDRHVLQPAVI